MIKRPWRLLALASAFALTLPSLASAHHHYYHPPGTGSTDPTGPTGPTDPTTPADSTQPNGGPAGDWTLAFDDEFDGTSLNTNAWTTHDGWINQNNVTDSTSNVTVAGGVATLTLASLGSGAELASTAATLQVGEYAEARVDFAGDGALIYDWPAWWTSGPNWPAAGENDVAEGLGTLTVNYHSPSGAHNQGTVPGTWSNGFHTYGIYRGPNYSNVYWDGTLVDSYPTDDNHQPQSLLFTIGAGNVLSFGAGGAMAIDYVRVWDQ